MFVCSKHIKTLFNQSLYVITKNLLWNHEKLCIENSVTSLIRFHVLQKWAGENRKKWICLKSKSNLEKLWRIPDMLYQFYYATKSILFGRKKRLDSSKIRLKFRGKHNLRRIFPTDWMKQFSRQTFLPLCLSLVFGEERLDSSICLASIIIKVQWTFSRVFCGFQ